MNNEQKIEKLYKKCWTDDDFDADMYLTGLEHMDATNIVFENETNLLEEMEKFLNKIGYELLTDPLLKNSSTGSIIIVKKE
jgi:hypothetical protein